MAYQILEECINCHACASECPNDAISQSDTIFLIDAGLCTECADYFDEPQCVAICPVNCIVQIQNNQETDNNMLSA